jgi:hypothetical protein
MNLSIILYFILLKTISGTNNITKLESSANTISKIISCYSCLQPLYIDPTNLFDAMPNYLKNNAFCTNRTKVKVKKIKKINTANSLCAINIVLAENTNLKLKEKEKRMVIHFTTTNKNNCHLSESLYKKDVICLKSSCKLLSRCCNTNLCNTVENFNLTVLAVYSNPMYNKFTNSYTQYSNTKCRIAAKSKNVNKNQPCIVTGNYLKNTADANNKNISDQIKTTLTTPTTPTTPTIAIAGCNTGYVGLFYLTYLLPCAILFYQNTEIDGSVLH